MTNRNLPGFLRDHERHGIRFVTQTKPRAVAQAEVAVEVFALGEGKNTRRRHDAITADDHAAIVQNGLGMKNSEGEFF